MLRNIKEMKLGDIVLELKTANGKRVMDSGFIEQIDDQHGLVTIFWFNEMKSLSIRKWMISDDGKETKYQWIGGPA